MICPNCKCGDVESSIFQENSGSKTITKTKSKYKEKGHGIIWWLLIGWWWWIVDITLWIVAFFPRLIVHLFAKSVKKKKYTGSSTSASVTTNDVTYKTICLCKECGHRWEHVPISNTVSVEPEKF
jgi:hypothetical protein